ncbi:hypothetical protein D9757_004462 [Collybiopsis confluens]|uniref:Uncharacterized protein n=1 Tax=Collybiopsis confluens TaxID=2823264 RepID=A0A8H5HWB9_9AGAR|nr:hypothetical protein D9757_004462 [Collybiopsis confluens]
MATPHMATVTSNDRDILSQVGYSLQYVVIGLQKLIVRPTGLYLGVSGISIRLLARKGLRSRPHQIALFLQICLLVNALCAVISDSAVPLMELYAFLVQLNAGSPYSLQEKANDISNSAVITRLKNLFVWSGTITFNRGYIGDLESVGSLARKQIDGMDMDIVGNMQCSVQHFICYGSKLAKRISKRKCWSGIPGQLLLDTFSPPEFLGYSGNRLQNMGDTSVFGREYKSYSSGSQVQKILWAVVESGVIFCILQVAYTIVSMTAITTKYDTDRSELSEYEASFVIIQPFGVMVMFQTLLENLSRSPPFRYGKLAALHLQTTAPDSEPPSNSQLAS